jgi:glycyl-tRNA synthetase beta chain
MPDFLLELRSEEIPARMQAKAEADLARLFAEQLGATGLYSQGIQTYATPRRLALIARGLPESTQPVREETKGPRSSAPPQALEGFLRKTGLARDQLEERDGVFYAIVEKPGRATADVLAAAIPAIIRAFPWPKSMRWGEASIETTSLRWVRPLQGIVALFGEDIVPFEIAGVASGAATVGHRFHHPGIITIGGAHDYAEKLRACHVIVDPAERRRIIAEGAGAAASAAGLSLVEDEGLVAENAGLTEWPVPLLGEFDPAFLEVPPEVIQLTMRTNQKYFALEAPPRDGEGDHAQHGGGGAVPGSEPPPSALRAATSPSRGGLAPHFICTANIEASDGGEAIVRGNRKVLAARLSDAKFFWEQDLKVPLRDQAKKLGQIVFHEKLGTVADKVDRVAKLARWLVEEGIVKSSPGRGGGPAEPVEGAPRRPERVVNPLHHPADGPPPRPGEDLAALAESAARLCKADLVTSMVGEFPELQGVIGGHLARAQGEPDAVADAIRDHYKPVGQGDEVPTAPVTVAVSLADKLDTIFSFFAVDLVPTGSKDPFALRRAALGVLRLSESDLIRLSVQKAFFANHFHWLVGLAGHWASRRAIPLPEFEVAANDFDGFRSRIQETLWHQVDKNYADAFWQESHRRDPGASSSVIDFFVERLKVQQREAGVRHDLIDAVFASGGDDDSSRLLARVRALQAFVETPEGVDLLAGYKRAANILKKEGYNPSPLRGEGQKILSYTPLPEEAQLIAALDSAEPSARAAVEAEDFEGAMAALASLRAPVDAFFDKVTVNDPDPAKRTARLDLLARMRDAVHAVADFSRIEG